MFFLRKGGERREEEIIGIVFYLTRKSGA